MSGFELASAVISALAWPVVVVGLAVVFRGAVRDALAGLARLRLPGGVEVEFARATVHTAVSTVKAITEVPAKGGAGSDSPPAVPELSLAEELADLAELAPGAAVAEAYGRVEQALRELVERNGGPLPQEGSGPARKLNVGGLLRVARRRGVISEESVEAVRGLVVMHHLALRGGAGTGMSVERAMDYLTLVDATLYALHRGKR